MPKLPNHVPVPQTIQNIPTIETSQRISPTNRSSGQGGSKRSLRIDAKLFSLLIGGGLFVAIAVYYGGAQRGCVTIPASFNHAGWSLIHKSKGFLKIWEPFWKRKIL